MHQLLSPHGDIAKLLAPDPVIVLVILRYLLMNSLIPRLLMGTAGRDKAN